MARFIKKQAAEPGKPPGSLIFVGNQKMEKARIRSIDYSTEHCEEHELNSIQELGPFKESTNPTWINIDGLHDIELIRELGLHFDLHPLLLDSILDTGSRPQIQEYDNTILIIVKMLYLKDNIFVRSEQFSIVLGENFLITFQEVEGDVFEPVRRRLRSQKGRIRARGLDYLSYAILDTIVGHYTSIVESVGRNIEEVEEEVLSRPSKELLETLYMYKRELNFLEKVVRPGRDCIYNFAKLESDLVDVDSTQPFLKDLLSNVTHAVEVSTTYREILSDQLNIYHTNVAARLNDILRVLTIFSVIFIPLTFIAGVYGTNFKYLPELEYTFAYPLFWLVLLLTAGGMTYYFKRKKWL